MSAGGLEDRTPHVPAAFVTTHWSVVLAARDGSSEEAMPALEKLCQTYWPPVYAFVRRQGHGIEEAQDLTQEFFCRLLEKGYLEHLIHRGGKFRSFLLKFVQHFLSDERDKARALKRGHGRVAISLDALGMEERAAIEPADQLSPERAFDRLWARTVLQQSLNQLRGEYAGKGKTDLFNRLKDLQPTEHGAQSYAALGKELGMSEGAVKVAVHRLRQRHGELLREEIAQTVSTPSEVEDEIRYLIQVLGS